MKNTETAGGVVLNKGRVLVVAQRNGVWSLPKGHLDEGEDTITAARREIYEESGVRKLKLIKKLGSYERFKINRDGGDDESELKTIHVFLFTTEQEELKPVDPENPEALWVEKEAVVNYLTHKKDVEFYKSIVNEF